MLIRLDVLYAIVLIDTQWNVNFIEADFDAVTNYRFNRYIVECKSLIGSGRLLTPNGFNRYIVECKSQRTTYQNSLGSVLIDTQWNVNVKTET